MTPPELLEKLPSNIRIGPFDFEIALRKRGRGFPYHGLFEGRDKFRITLDSTMHSGELIVDTLLHEIMHGLYFAAAMGGGETEERVVNALATGLTQVFRENRWLLPWVRAGLRK